MQTDELDVKVARIVSSSPLFGPLLLERKHFLEMALDEELISKSEYSARVWELIEEVNNLVEVVRLRTSPLAIERAT